MLAGLEAGPSASRSTTIASVRRNGRCVYTRLRHHLIAALQRPLLGRQLGHDFVRDCADLARGQTGGEDRLGTPGIDWMEEDLYSLYLWYVFPDPEVLHRQLSAGIESLGHGSQFISHAFQDELKTLGIESSPSFIRQPEGNGCVERFIRTLKERLLWLHRFRTVEELNQALRDFARRFNNHWIIGRIGYRTPAAHRRILLGEAA